MPQSIASTVFVADTNQRPSGASEHERRSEFDLRRREQYDSFSNYLAIPAAPTPAQDPTPPNGDRGRQFDVSHTCDRDARDRDATETDRTAARPDPPQRRDLPAHPITAKAAQRPAECNSATTPETKSGAESIELPPDESQRHTGKPTILTELTGIFQAFAVELTTLVTDGPNVVAGRDAGPVSGSSPGLADVRSREHDLVEGSGLPYSELDLLTELISPEHKSPLDDVVELIEPASVVHGRALDSEVTQSLQSERLTFTEPQLTEDTGVDAWDPQHGSANAESRSDDSSGHWSQQSHPNLWSQVSSSHETKSQPSFFSTSETNGLDARPQPDDATRDEASRPRSYRIALDSPELGRITLRVQDQQGIRAHLIAQNEAAYQTLAAAMDDARQFLQDAGLSLAEFSLSHGQHHQTHQQATPNSSTTSSGTDSNEPPIRPTTAWSGRLNVLA